MTSAGRPLNRFMRCLASNSTRRTWTDDLSSAFTIPGRLKTHGSQQKFVLRRAGAGLVPSDVLLRPKTFQRLKHDVRFSDVLERLADECLTPASVARRGLFDARTVDRLRQRRNGGQYPTEQAYRLWSILVTEFWCRLFLDRRGAPLTSESKPQVIERSAHKFDMQI